VTSRPIILAAGGTGGHLFPARALAEELTARGRSVVLATDTRGRDYEGAFPGIMAVQVRAGTPSVAGLAAKLKAGADLVRGFFDARKHLVRLEPGAVVGFGGYPSLPTVLAALSLGIPAIIHEQNAVLGRANRVAARWADLIAASFSTTRFAPQGRTLLTGNPVRAAIVAAGQQPYVAPGPAGTIQLLVFGGSQGARIFSDAVPAALAALPGPQRARLIVVQQARPEDVARVTAAYQEAGISAEVSPFFGNMAELLAKAHLVIARSGASTCAELAAAGRPAILAPYPHATDDHQSANAAALSGGAILMPDRMMSVSALSHEIAALLAQPERLNALAAGMQNHARPDAAALLADAVERLAPAVGGPVPRRRIFTRFLALRQAEAA